MSNYVFQSIANERNVMSEAYTEEGNESVIWLFERWTDQTSYEAFQENRAAQDLSSVLETALLVPPKTILVHDLEPLTKQEWRETSRKEDDQLTIMLFVDAQAGTEEKFKDD